MVGWLVGWLVRVGWYSWLADQGAGGFKLETVRGKRGGWMAALKHFLAVDAHADELVIAVAGPVGCQKLNGIHNARLEAR